MAEDKPLYLEVADRLIAELVRLTPLIRQRVERARREGKELAPNVEKCLRAASVLKSLITDLEEEISINQDGDD